MKLLVYNSQARKDIAKCPKIVKARIASLLEMVSSMLALGAKDFKPMSTVGAGVYELRVRARL